MAILERKMDEVWVGKGERERERKREREKGKSFVCLREKRDGEMGFIH